MLQRKTLYDPIEYMIRRLSRRMVEGIGQRPPSPDPTDPSSGGLKCWDQYQDIELIRDSKLKLIKIIGEFFEMELTYNAKMMLHKVIGTCGDGYKAEIELIYDSKHLLTNVLWNELSQGQSNESNSTAYPTSSTAI